MRPARAPFALGLALAAAGSLQPSRARAEPAPYELSYSAPTGCPAEAAILKEVRDNVRDAASGDGARIALTITQDGSGFTGELSALDRSGKQGRRSIQGPTCSEVSQTLAFLAVLAIELGGRVEEEPVLAPAAAKPPPPAETVTKPAAPVERAPVVPPRNTWKFAGVLGAGVRGGLGPSVRPSVEAGVDVADTSVRALAPSLRAMLVGSLSRISHSAGTAELSLLAARFDGCPFRFGARAFGFRPCVGVELGAVFAHGELDGGRSVVEPWGSAEAGLRFETWLSRQILLELSGAALVPFFHTRYFFVPEQIVYVVPAVTGRASLVLGYRFQ